MHTPAPSVCVVALVILKWAMFDEDVSATDLVLMMRLKPNFGRRTVFEALVLALLPSGGADASAEPPVSVPSWPRILPTRTEMAVQVVDFGWTRNAIMFGTGGPDGAVTNEIHTLETDAHHVRFLFQNGLRTRWTISGASYAPTASAQSSPVDNAGVLVAPHPVTFGNAGQDLSLSEQLARPDVAQVTTLDLPPASSDTVYGDTPGYGNPPAIVFSDWMPFKPVTRNNGQQGYLVMLRVLTQSPRFTGVQPTYMRDQEFFAGTAARPWRALFLSGNAGIADYLDAPTVTDPEPLKHYLGNGLCCGVQAIGSRPGVTLVSVGDSILMGGGEPLGYLGPVRRAAERLSTPEHPVSHVAAAIFGCPSAAFLAAGREAIRTNKASCAFIQVWSGNDPQTIDASREACTAALGLARDCILRGVTPVLCSPAPRPTSSGTPELEAIRLWSMPLLRGLAAQGVPFLDINNIVGDGASNGRFTQFRPGLVAADDTHPNSTGNILLADAAVSILQSMPMTVV